MLSCWNQLIALGNFLLSNNFFMELRNRLFFLSVVLFSNCYIFVPFLTMLFFFCFFCVLVSLFLSSRFILLFKGRIFLSKYEICFFISLLLLELLLITEVS